MTTEQARNYVFENIAEIGNEMLLHNRLAMEVATAYIRYGQQPDNPNAAVSLVKSAEEWRDYKNQVAV